jgi:hypothetical protein
MLQCSAMAEVQPGTGVSQLLSSSSSPAKARDGDNKTMTDSANSAKRARAISRRMRAAVSLSTVFIMTPPRFQNLSPQQKPTPLRLNKTLRQQLLLRSNGAESSNLAGLQRLA